MWTDLSHFDARACVCAVHFSIFFSLSPSLSTTSGRTRDCFFTYRRLLHRNMVTTLFYALCTLRWWHITLSARVQTIRRRSIIHYLRLVALVMCPSSIHRNHRRHTTLRLMLSVVSLLHSFADNFCSWHACVAVVLVGKQQMAQHTHAYIYPFFAIMND